MTKLDNPVWFALSEQHRQHRLELDRGYFYDPLFCPFGAFNSAGNHSQAISAYSQLIADFYVVGEKPGLPGDVLLKDELICLQMVLKKLIPFDIIDEIVLLNEQHEQDLNHLVNLVQPGFFRQKTAALGNYYGIFQEGKLVAVTGERMKLDDHTEISAVVTHPLYTGRGYAKQLLTQTVNHIVNQQKNVFLHVNKKKCPGNFVVPTDRFFKTQRYKLLAFIKRQYVSKFKD